MGKLFSRFVLWLYGWKIQPDLPEEVHNCVMLAAPHTSNWDYVIARPAFKLLGINIRYTIKDSFMKFPMNLFFGPLGGIAIDRSPKNPGEKRKSMVEAMIDLFKNNENLTIMVTPEGTRSKRDRWKSGFYYTALGAGVPICLGFLDFEKKIAGVGGVIHPSGNFEEDLIKICAFYKDIPGKRPEKFSIDTRHLEKEEPA